MPTEPARLDFHDPHLRTLRGIAAAFSRETSVRLMTFLFLSDWGVRVLLGSWTKRDAWAALIIFVLWPVQEIALHRFCLHARPFTLWGRTIDMGKSHREHHRNPLLLNGFTPLYLFYFAPLLILSMCRLIAGSWPEALTAFGTWMILALNYEWTHFIVHCPYKPKTFWGRILKKNHLAHHYRNEKFLWEVSMPGLFDRLLFVYHGYSFWSRPRHLPPSVTTRTIF